MRVRWAEALTVLVMLALGTGYVGWWLSTQHDCLSLPPDGWVAEGVRPAVRGDCAVRAGELVTAARVDGITVYTVVRDGQPVEIALPHRAPDVGSVLRSGWSTVLFVVALFGVAAYAFARRRADPAAAALLVLVGGLLASTAAFLLGLPARYAFTGWPRWFFVANVDVVYTLAWSGLAAFAVLFPTPLSARRTALVVAYAAPGAVLATAAALAPGDAGSPLWLHRVGTVQSVLTVVVIGFAVAFSAWRFQLRSADPVVRAQLRWIGAAGWMSCVLGLAFWFMPHLILGRPLLPADWIGVVNLPAVAAFAVALLRYRLFDLDVVLGRALVYATLTACIVVLYLGVVTLFASVLQTTTTSPAAIVGAGVAAVAVNPLRIGLQRAVNRLLYGDRDDPYVALSRLGQRLSAVAGHGDVLAAAAADVARALRVPYVAIDLLADGETRTVATAGSIPGAGRLRDVPLVLRGETLGWLRVAPRAPDERPSAADQRLLADLARQVAAAAREVQLHQDLQRSRERIVLAREEERRALRRTLHDELGPAMAAIALRAETARRLADRPAERSAMQHALSGIRTDATGAATELRRLAYNLRPPSLDEHGLLGALRERGDELAPLTVTVELPTDLGALPAAVEVAAYRIAVGAMTNAARHAAATHCTVRLARLAGELQIEIVDDGVGLPPDFRAGVGIAAMRERAAELGGQCRHERPAAGGSRVVARMPIGDAP